MKHPSLFFSTEHAVARFQAIRAADDQGRSRVRLSHPSTRTQKPTVMQLLLGIGPLLLAFIVIPLNTARRRRLRAARRRS
jgi:chloramphenicol 3-O-phosphotransferase